MGTFNKLDAEMKKEQQKNPSTQIRISHAYKLFYCMPLKRNPKTNKTSNTII